MTHLLAMLKIIQPGRESSSFCYVSTLTSLGTVWDGSKDFPADGSCTQYRQILQLQTEGDKILSNNGSARSRRNAMVIVTLIA